MSESKIPVYKITVPITKDQLTLSISGDWHYGVRNVNKNEIIRVAKKETDQHKGNIFRIFTGDMIENALKTSVGHNYDISIPDPQMQKEGMKDILKTIMLHQYGETAFKQTSATSSYRAVGVCGNHEYRTRKQTGQWLDKDIYDHAKILSAGMQCIIELTIVNKKLKLSKTYKIYVAHRPNSSTTSSLAGIHRSLVKKRSDVPGCDLYVFGHFHKRIILPDGFFNSVTGTFQKVLYVINPSPMYDSEYADVAGYAPLGIGHYVNCFLPLDENKSPYAII